MNECESKESTEHKTERKMSKRKTQINMGTAVRKHVTKKEGIILEYTEEEEFWKTYMEKLDCETDCLQFKLLQNNSDEFNFSTAVTTACW
jgi:hypothetical protein